MINSTKYNKVNFRRLIIRLRGLFQCRYAGILPSAAGVFYCAREIRQCKVVEPQLALMPVTRKLALLGRFDFEYSAFPLVPVGRQKKSQ